MDHICVVSAVETIKSDHSPANMKLESMTDAENYSKPMEYPYSQELLPSYLAVVCNQDSKFLFLCSNDRSVICREFQEQSTKDPPDWVKFLVKALQIVQSKGWVSSLHDQVEGTSPPTELIFVCLKQIYSDMNSHKSNLVSDQSSGQLHDSASNPACTVTMLHGFYSTLSIQKK